MPENDPTVRCKVIDGHVIWELVEEEAPAVPSISLGEIPRWDRRKRRSPAPAATEGEAESKEGRISSPIAPSPWPMASSSSPRTSTSS